MVAEDAADIHCSNNLRPSYKDILSLSLRHEDLVVSNLRRGFLGGGGASSSVERR